MTGDFDPEQKRYLEGFVAGLQIARTAGNLAARTGGEPLGGAAPTAAPVAAAASEPTGPDAPHWRAQDMVTRAGGKLSDQ